MIAQLNQSPIRICVGPVYAPAPWHLWHQTPERNIWRTETSTAPVPAGAVEVKPDDLLPVTEADRQQEEESIRRRWQAAVKCGSDETLPQYRAMLIGGDIDDAIRRRRRDPSHDAHAFRAAVRLTADEADEIWVRAVTSARTTNSQIVIREGTGERAGKWMAWCGVGSLMESVCGSGGLAWFSSRSEARDAALRNITARLWDLRLRARGLLTGWHLELDAADPWSLIRELASASRRLSVWGVVSVPERISIRSAPEDDGRSSWDLPVIEQIPIEHLPAPEQHEPLRHGEQRQLGRIAGQDVTIHRSRRHCHLCLRITSSGQSVTRRWSPCRLDRLRSEYGAQFVAEVQSCLGQ